MARRDEMRSAEPPKWRACIVLVLVSVLVLSGLSLGPAGAEDSISTPDTPSYISYIGGATRMVLDSSGFPVAVYHDLNGDDLKVLRCGDATCSSGNTVAVPDTSGDEGIDPSLVLDSSGFPVVAYFDSTHDDLKVLRCGDAACMSGNVITRPDADGIVGSNSSIALDSSGFPVVSYRDRTNGDLKVLRCGDATCSSGNTITSPDTLGDVGRRTSVALDASGFPIVAYHDFTNEDLKVLVCGDASCSSGNTITSPDTLGDVGEDPSMVLDSSGFPAVAYHDETTDTVKVLRCGDASCSSGNTITSPAAVNWLDGLASLALDASGFPVVSYNTGGTIKVLRCGDSSCSSANTITTIATGLSSFVYSSLALDSSGFPVVSYRNPNADLAVLHCDDPVCAPPPDIVLGSPAQQSAFAQGQVVLADYACVPGPTGAAVVSCVGDVATGAAIDAATVGVHTFLVTAIDTGGNEATLTHTYEVSGSPGVACDPGLVTIDMNTNGGDGDGTIGDDVILGTPGRDVIRGLGGDDTICGGGGDDLIRGGPGADLILGEGGDDELLGQGGGDFIDGGTGDDVIAGQAGVDSLTGGTGNDVIDGQGAADSIDGGQGNDTINGHNGADDIDGGDGADVLKGQTGPDTLRGGDGDDDLFGGNGSDMLYGGSGFDKCSGNLGPDQAESASCEQTPGVEVLF